MTRGPAVTCDSRQVTPGALYFAIPGVHCDGAQYIAQARSLGAARVIGQSPLCDEVVPNARAAFAHACANYFDHPSHALRLCGITGTNGKTTTAGLLRDMLAQGGLLPGLLTTVVTQWPGHDEPSLCTTPDAKSLQSDLAAMRDAGSRAAVMEVSSHSIDQSRIDGCQFAAVGFTNLTQDHLDYHKTLEAYFQTKARLFLEHPEAAAIINRDDAHGRRLLEMLAARTNVVSYSLEEAEAKFSPTGMDVRFQLGTRVLDFHTALCGKYNLANILCAAHMAFAIGVNADAILMALVQAKPHWGRLEPILPHVFVDYAHTDDALINVLKTLREICSGRVLCLFGCGGDRDRTKRPKMGLAVDANADVAIVTSDNPRTEDPEAIIQEILPGFKRLSPIVEPDRRKAIAAILKLRQPEDVVLIAGKGHETYQEIQGVKHPFSDAQVILEEAQHIR